MSNKLLLVARHILTMGLQKCLKAGSVKFANSLSPPSIVKQRKQKQPRQKSWESTTPPEPPNKANQGHELKNNRDKNRLSLSGYRLSKGAME